MKKIISLLLILAFANLAMAQSRAGSYALNAGHSVDITDAPRSIKFNFGASVYEDDFRLGGTARLVSRNVYEYRKIIRGKVDNSLCRIRFTFSGRWLTVKEGLECTNERFPDVSLNGRYEKVM